MYYQSNNNRVFLKEQKLFHLPVWSTDLRDGSESTHCLKIIIESKKMIQYNDEKSIDLPILAYLDL